MQQIFVGIDVSKARLDVACRPHATTHSEPNNADGIAALVARLKALNPPGLQIRRSEPALQADRRAEPEALDGTGDKHRLRGVGRVPE